jgi:hypothetical protein
LSDSFSALMNFAVITTKAVCALKDKGNPVKKSDSSHFQIIYYKYQALAMKTAYTICVHCVYIKYIILN